MPNNLALNGHRRALYIMPCHALAAALFCLTCLHFAPGALATGGVSRVPAPGESTLADLEACADVVNLAREKVISKLHGRHEDEACAASCCYLLPKDGIAAMGLTMEKHLNLPLMTRIPWVVRVLLHGVAYAKSDPNGVWKVYRPPTSLMGGDKHPVKEVTKALLAPSSNVVTVLTRDALLYILGGIDEAVGEPPLERPAPVLVHAARHV